MKIIKDFIKHWKNIANKVTIDFKHKFKEFIKSLQKKSKVLCFFQLS